MSIFGANYRTTLLGLGSAVFAFLTMLAAAPYELGEVAQFIPPEHKAKLFIASAIATMILRIWKNYQTADAKVASLQIPPSNS